MTLIEAERDLVPSDSPSFSFPISPMSYPLFLSVLPQSSVYRISCDLSALRFFDS